MRTIIALTLLAIGSIIMNAQAKILLTNGEKTVKATLADPGSDNLQALPNGIYLLSYNNGIKRTTKKLFIKR